MLDQATCESSHSAISSLDSEDGALLYVPPDGQMIDLFGQVPHRANLSARQAKDLGLLTSATSGHVLGISSGSASLQLSLASKLQVKLAGTGSPLYELNWKEWDMQQGPQICALRASARFTSGNGFTGLPTPSGTSNHGKNHVAGRLDEWGGSSNPFRGKEIGKIHSPGFELWVMGYPAAWREQMPPAMPLSRRLRKPGSKP